jgi:hypothetical protein
MDSHQNLSLWLLVMASLTSILLQLAPILGLSTAALYERQRALVRLGLLPKPEGRGRGSGADASPETVALLVIAVMATDNLSENDDRIIKLAHAKFDARAIQKCGLTAAPTFAMAVAAILAEPKKAEALLRISVTRSNNYWVRDTTALALSREMARELARRTDQSAAIYYIKGSRKLIEIPQPPRASPTAPPNYRISGRSRASIFGRETFHRDSLQIEATLYRDAVQEIARILASHSEGN